MSQIENPGVIGSVAAGADLVARRLVTAAGAYTSGGTIAAMGVTINDTKSGQMAAVVTSGIVVIESGGTFGQNAQVAPAASGKIVAVTEGDFVVGVALDASTASGQFIRVRLI